MSDNVEIRRFFVGDEILALNAITDLIPEEEREYQVPSLKHLNTLLADKKNSC